MDTPPRLLYAYWRYIARCTAGFFHQHAFAGGWAQKEREYSAFKSHVFRVLHVQDSTANGKAQA